MPQRTPELAAAIAGATLEEIAKPGRVDAIVVGAGAAGGLAAALLTEAGLRVLVLDAGWRAPFWRAPIRRSVGGALEALSNPRMLRMIPPSLRWKGQRALTMLGAARQPIQSQCYAWPSAPESFVDDKRRPYEAPDDAPFNWIRVHGLGGRMIVPLHGRQYYRHGAHDFRPDDGLSPAWPFAPSDLDPWYELVERRIGLSGRREGNAWVPDSTLADERAPLASETALMTRINARFPQAQPILSRYASPADTISAAAVTGRLLVRTGAFARHVEVEAGRARGVVFHDRRTGALQRAEAPIVFLCASTLESTRILMTSRNDTHPEGLGGASNALGRHLMDHVSSKIEGVGPALESYVPVTQPGPCVHLPRFDLRTGGSAARGFGVRVYQSSSPDGGSHFVAVADAEMLPRSESRVTLSARTDASGVPTLRIECRRGAWETAIAQAQAVALADLAEIADATPRGPVALDPPGAAVHECGTARMGDDPATSVLNPDNQCWDAKGLYVTDGAAFPSQGAQNPTLTIMALTARACAHAAKR